MQIPLIACIEHFSQCMEKFPLIPSRTADNGSYNFFQTDTYHFKNLQNLNAIIFSFNSSKIL